MQLARRGECAPLACIANKTARPDPSGRALPNKWPIGAPLPLAQIIRHAEFSSGD